MDNQSSSKPVTAKENPALGTAIAKLDARAGTVVDGYTLMAAAVSWQTKVPVEILKKQHTASGLSYGQLLVANSLATGSAKSFDEIMALQARTESWSRLAEKLHVSLHSIVARANTATESITYAEARRKLRREENFKETDFQRGGRTRDPRGG